MTEKARQMGTLGGDLRAALPAAIVPHVRLATITDGCLVLQAESPAWAAQLRFKTPEILASLRQHPAFDGVRSIRIRNNLDTPSAVAAGPRTRLRMGRDAAAALRAQAGCTEDPKLKAALERLARRGGG